MDNSALAELSIFHGMNDAQREQVLSLAKRVQVKSGDKIITQGKMVRNLWFILSGSCEVSRRTDSGCTLKLAELGPLVQFGEMSFFHSAPHSADVTALTDMELIKLAREDYDQLVAEGHPMAFKLALNALEQMADRLRRTDQWITELVCQENHQPSASEWADFCELILHEK